VAVLADAGVKRRSWSLYFGVFVFGIAAFYAATTPKSIPALDSASAGSFDADLIARGAALAAIGDCDSCHTAKDGARLAGGRAIPTPFGSVYSTNITPDRATGLGLWSASAFERAMREGISRDGRYLYPAFPYAHFTAVAAPDMQALYAYLMSRPAVSAPARENSLWLPLKCRRLLAVWNAFFLKKGWQGDPRQGPEWNRGAYLVNGLGHCGACHTPRNLLGAERANHALAGGQAEGWDAYALNGGSPAPVRWTVESLTAYLRTGWHAGHGVAHGPMAAVTDDLARAPESAAHAMSVYIESAMAGRKPAERHRRAAVQASNGGRGADIYAASCASCHESGAPPPLGAADLSLSSAVNASGPRNMIVLTLAGVPAADGRPAGMMPRFDGAISDEDLASLLRFVRAQFSDRPEWEDLMSGIRAARRDLQKSNEP
jgi:mono/diheme cytochrome c family protein